MGRKPDIEVYSPYNVLDACHIAYKSGVKNARIECPRCHKFDFYMNMENGLGHCFRPSCAFRANHTSYYAEAHGLTNLEDARAEMYAYMGVPFQRKDGKSSGSSQKESSKETKESSKKKATYKKGDFAKESQIADIKIRDICNRKILDIHPLIPRHQDDLMARGVKKEELSLLSYCSYGYSDETNLARVFVKDGIDTAGVPGFFDDEDGMRKIRPLKKGILIPFRNSYGQIQGFQLRKNNEELKEWFENGKMKKEKKCNWLSSTGLKGGTKINGYCHYACDFVYNFNEGRVLPVIMNHEIWLTEGGMKGDLIHLFSNKSVIAVPGVSSLEEFSKELPFLKEHGVRIIHDIFDMDYLTNPDVSKQRDKLKEIVEKAGISYQLEKWNVELNEPDKKTLKKNITLKGYDDYLAYHLRGIIPK